jgi:hypothetical protein
VPASQARRVNRDEKACGSIRDRSPQRRHTSHGASPRRQWAYSQRMVNQGTRMTIGAAL